MLVRSSSSVSCRGWEENDSDLIETDHKTLREFIIVDVLMEDWEMSREEAEEELKESDGYGCWEVCSDTSINFEGEESCVTYSVYIPTQEDVDLLLRNMK